MNIKLKYGIFALLIIIFQSIIKLTTLIITGSLSTLSEALDTIIDIVFVSIILYSIYQSQKPPDYEHMYGHQKIDSVGGLVQGIILIILYIFLIFNAIQAIIYVSFHIDNPETGFQLLIVSFLVNIIFSRILIWQGRISKSIALEVQGLNLFQDSLRTIIILLSFFMAMFFDIIFLDPYFSIIISIWVIYGAVSLSYKGITHLIDVNPINAIILEEIRRNIFKLDYVNGVEDLRVRSSGNQLFFEIYLSVEDHISIAHARKITNSIRAMNKKYLPNYNVETIVEMNPLGGEAVIGEKIYNLLYSMKIEFPEIIEIKELNIFSIEEKYFISVTIIIENNLTLEYAHDICTKFENELKNQEPSIYRIITHMEAGTKKEKSSNQLICRNLDEIEKNKIKLLIDNILVRNEFIKGYHGFELWEIMDFCILELHVFLDGSLNIELVHKYISDIEKKIRENLKIANLQEIIIHSEPILGRSDGMIFDNKKE
ncbi:MAG: cation diffusion facilitator family transporter [Candidatus Lokiarchaeota archaeon]|nr:cation diffusion facilitator family transporter [Candidatus Lokiarchaeota archaeon]